VGAVDGFVLGWSPPAGTRRPALPVVLATPDPVGALLRDSLANGHQAGRWAVARDETTVRDLLVASRGLPRLVIRSGSGTVDVLLGGVAPLLPVLLDDLTERQRVIARLLLLDGLHQAEIARRLGVSRPTISVAVARGHLREIARLADAVRTLLDGDPGPGPTVGI
jgi:DNA-binding CsgD family transcriptional regulator